MEFVDVVMSLLGYARVKDNDHQDPRVSSASKVIYEKRGAGAVSSFDKYFSSEKSKPSIKTHLANIFSNLWEALAHVMRPNPVHARKTRQPGTDVQKSNLAPVNHSTSLHQSEEEIKSDQASENLPHRQVLNALMSLYKVNPKAEFNGTDEFKAWAKAQYLITRNEDRNHLTGDEIIVLSHYLDRQGLLEPGTMKAQPVSQPEIAEAKNEENDADNKITEKSPGQLKFENFLLDFGAINSPHQELNEGNPALDTDCYDYAVKVQTEILGEKQNKFSESEKETLDAAKAILSKYRLIQSQKNEAARLDNERLERKAKEEVRAAMQPGQADFEEFLANYKKAADEGRALTLYAKGKYFDHDCLQYAHSQRGEGASVAALDDFFRAAVTFGKWPADVQAPPEPPPPRAGAKPKVQDTKSAPAQNDQRAAMGKLISDIKEHVKLLAQNTDLTEGDIWYALEGLVIATDNAEEATASSEKTLAEWKALKQAVQDRSKYINQTFYDVTETQEKFGKAAALIEALREIAGTTGRSQNAVLKELAVAVAGSRARELLDLAQAATQLKPRSAYDFSLKKIFELSADEAAEAQQQFNDYVDAFRRHGNIGDLDVFFKSREGNSYLNLLCLSYASHMNEVYRQSSALVEADQQAQTAAGLLLNEFSKRRQGASFS